MNDAFARRLPRGMGEDILTARDLLSDEAREGVWEYLKFIQESEEVEPTQKERRAIARGEEDMARGEVVRWRDRKKSPMRSSLPRRPKKVIPSCRPRYPRVWTAVWWRLRLIPSAIPRSRTVRDMPETLAARCEVGASSHNVDEIAKMVTGCDVRCRGDIC